jgi:hypothetical protein
VSASNSQVVVRIREVNGRTSDGGFVAAVGPGTASAARRQCKPGNGHCQIRRKAEWLRSHAADAGIDNDVNAVWLPCQPGSECLQERFLPSPQLRPQLGTAVLGSAECEALFPISQQRSVETLKGRGRFIFNIDPDRSGEVGIQLPGDNCPVSAPRQAQHKRNGTAFHRISRPSMVQPGTLSTRGAVIIDLQPIICEAKKLCGKMALYQSASQKPPTRKFITE